MDQLNGHSEQPVTLLPQRNPGASGISGGEVEERPVESASEPELQDESEYEVEAESEVSYDLEPEADYEPEPWEEPVAEQPRPTPVDTSAFFASRAHATTNGAHEPEPESELDVSDISEISDADASTTAGSEDAIYQRMLSEWLVDPTDMAKSSDLNWQSVWDHGWSVAEAAEDSPVETHTEHGLPVREPGARLVPGAASVPRHGTNGGYPTAERTAASTTKTR